jgi:hypothetical protein
MLLQQQQLDELCAMVCSSNSSSSSRGSGISTARVDGLPSAKQLAQEYLAAGLVASQDSIAQLLNALSREYPELQPSAAAVAMGVMQPADQRHAADVGPVGTTGLQDLLNLVAALCGSLLSSSSFPAEPEDQDGFLASWVSGLTPDAAAAALFAVGLGVVQPPAARDQSTNAVHAAAPLLCLELYRSAKQTGDSLVYDLALVADARVGTREWHRGKPVAGFISTHY